MGVLAGLASRVTKVASSTTEIIRLEYGILVARQYFVLTYACDGKDRAASKDSIPFDSH